MECGRSLISTMGTVRVSEMRLHSTRLKTLSASLNGGPPAAASLLALAGPTSSRGCRQVLMKSVGHTGPTSVHRIYIRVSTLYT
jgi:hypothetical protein